MIVLKGDLGDVAVQIGIANGEVGGNGGGKGWLGQIEVPAEHLGRALVSITISARERELAAAEFVKTSRARQCAAQGECIIGAHLEIFQTAIERHRQSDEVVGAVRDQIVITSASEGDAVATERVIVAINLDQIYGDVADAVS